MMNTARNDCCGPPPPYKDELLLHNQGSIKKNKDSDPQTLTTNDYPPSYLLQKQNVLPPASGFAYIQPTVLSINNCDLNICILVTILVMLLIYVTHKHGCIHKLLGRRLSLREEMITVFMFAIPSYGLIIPGSAPITFMFFLAIFSAFAVAHACTTPVQRSWFEVHQVLEV